MIAICKIWLSWAVCVLLTTSILTSVNLNTLSIKVVSELSTGVIWKNLWLFRSYKIFIVFDRIQFCISIFTMIIFIILDKQSGYSKKQLMFFLSVPDSRNNARDLYCHEHHGTVLGILNHPVVCDLRILSHSVALFKNYLFTKLIK